MSDIDSKDKEATEIRATEEKKGGLKYELVLADPAENPPPKLNDVSPPKTPISVEDIQNKLKAAEERRISMEAAKLTQLSEKMNKLQEVSQKKQERISSFVEEAKKQHVQKMESNKENKDVLAKMQQEKLKEHERRCSEARKSLLGKMEQTEKYICDKMNRATIAKDSQLLALQERLRLHDQHVQEVKNACGDAVAELMKKHETKLKAANEKREKILCDITERLKLQEKRVLQVRQLNEETVKEQEIQTLESIAKKLEEAEQKRLSYIDSKQQKLLEHDRHIEEVRQNKQATAANDIQTSG